eukprot:NODE_15757_length_1032_cov_3.638674.p2 GENE.NODE_15757_length_1032_cov_3.638674~~NODE_15757_length_1032_cov_3.638674.p2  ORF type:complete len:117 (-),score=31.48 NODE_15757_length_1032_cov_3.638674:484-834(-)
MSEPLSYGSGLTPAEGIILATKVQTTQTHLSQKLCWERCVDAMAADVPQSSLACADACVSKFAETAMVVSYESQKFQAEVMRQQQLQAFYSRSVVTIGFTSLIGCLGCYLFRAGDD